MPGSDRSERDETEAPEANGRMPADPEREGSSTPTAADGDQLIAGERPDDEAIPISPARRRLKITIALIFIAVVLGFLIWFTATHTEQYN